MTLVLNAAPGDPAANTYLTEAQALILAESIPQALVWREDDNARDQAPLLLVGATTLLDDEFDWQGVRASTTQALGWPRVGLTHRDSSAPIASDSIPPFIERATLELALYLFTQDITAGQDYSSGVIDMTLGGVQVKTTSGAMPRIPPSLRTFLSGYYKRQRSRSLRLLRT